MRTILLLPRRRGKALLGILCALCSGMLVGCRTAPLDAARSNFSRGRLDPAAESLAAHAPTDNESVLFYMERGSIRQALGDHEHSVRDFNAAFERLEELETYSLSLGAASLVINDSVQPFRGAPFERTLLHTLAAASYFALGDWDSAAVEARRILLSLDPERRGAFPEDAASRWIAGLAFEMIQDPSNAKLQYRLADQLRDAIPSNSAEFPESAITGGPELVVIVLLGDRRRGSRAGTWGSFAEPQSFVYDGDNLLGAGRPLTDTVRLAEETERMEAARRAAKTASRLVVKEAVAQTAAKSAESELIGDLVRLILFGLFEQPDVRRWETLPRWIHVARVPCPPDLNSYTLVIRDSGGAILRKHTVSSPIHRRGNIRISVVRDLPAAVRTVRP